MQLSRSSPVGQHGCMFGCMPNARNMQLCQKDLDVALEQCGQLRDNWKPRTEPGHGARRACHGGWDTRRRTWLRQARCRRSSFAPWTAQGPCARSTTCPSRLAPAQAGSVATASAGVPLPADHACRLVCHAFALPYSRLTSPCHMLCLWCPHRNPSTNMLIIKVLTCYSKSINNHHAHPSNCRAGSGLASVTLCGTCIA